MKKLTFWKSLFLLCALIVGSSSAWGQSDYSALYTSNVTLTAGDNSSSCTVNEHNGVKCGTSKKTGSVSFTVPSGTKYLHIHVAAWNGETSTTISITPTGNGVPTSISLTADSGIQGTSTDFTLNGTESSTNFYKVITFTNALTSNTTYTITSSKRFVIWGVNSEAVSTDPSSNVSFTNKTPSINYPATKTYSQVPTTATGYTGTITYTMTANTAGATIDASTGLVTVTKGGSVTVKALAAAVSGSFAGSEDTYTLTVNDTRTSAGLAWSAESANVQYGADNNVFPTLTNTHNVPVTYESTNQAAATIDANTGEITLKDYTGITTISAIFAGNDDYLPQTVTYELNVTKAPFAIKDGVFDFVEAGGANPIEDYGSGVSPTTDNNYYVNATKTWTAGNVTMTTNGRYRWWSNGKTLRFYYDSDASTASSFTLTAPTNNVITKIVFVGGSNFDVSDGTLSNTNNGTWTGASNSVTFTYAGTSSSSNISKITVTYTTANQTFTPAKTYTTLTSAYALNFTDVSGLKAYIATEVSEGNVQMTQVNKVPAGTGLVLKATTPNTAVDVPVFDGKNADDVTGNKMAGSATETTAVAENGGYILKDGVFQPASAGTLAAGKAYLNIAVSSGARALEMSFEDTTTGINGVEEIVPATTKTRKVVKNGRLVIETANGEFTIDGARMK